MPWHNQNVSAALSAFLSAAARTTWTIVYDRTACPCLKPPPPKNYCAQEDLLLQVQCFVYRMDLTNLVTCAYQLAHMFKSVQSEDRPAWKQQLLASPIFSRLLGE